MKRRSINGKVQKAIALIASLSVAACQFSAAIPVNAAETEEAQPAIAAESDEAQTEKTDETEEAQSEKTDETEETQSEKTDETEETQSENTDETEQSEKLKAEPCLSVDKTVLPASAAGSRVKVNVYINDENMGSSKYYQQPDVYIDIDRRLQYCGFRNGMKDGTKGIGLQGEMFINAKHKHTLRFYSESGLGANGTFAVIEVEIPKDAQPGDIYYFNICDAGGNITKVSIPETDDIAGETDKPLKTADTSDDKYLKDTSYDGYILIDPESESDNPQIKKDYETVSEDELEYDVYEDHAEVIFCQYEADKAVIKPEINGKKVTAIADYAFAGANITSIEIPDTVTSIGDFAFKSTRLKSVELPGSLVNIGESAFEESKLESAVLHEGIETVGRNVFSCCWSFKELKLPSTLKEISIGMCEGCSRLTDVEIPSGVTSIGNAAFYGTAITTAKVPEGVKNIGSFAFSYCKGLEHVFLPSGLESIGDCAFSRCQLLESIELPDTLKSIGSDVFGETRITKIDIPASVTEIEENAFLYSSINTINYADELETLPDNAYSGAEKMKTVKLPSKLTAIPDFCFDGCTLLSSVDIPETVTNIGRYAFSGCGVKELVIPDTVNTLEEGAFSCSHLTSVTIPDSITELPDKLFEGSDIKTVKLPSGLKVITEDMFYSCNSLAEVDIPVSVTEIQSNAFAETPLSSLYIPESVTKIAADAFWHSKIETIYGVKGSYAETFAKEQGIRFAEKSAETKAKAGDVNCDDTVDMADAVLIMQALANPNKYGIGGSDEKALTEQGAKNGDVDTDAAGLTSNDALKIQQFLLGIVKSL